MSMEMKSHVIHLLETYPERKRKIAVLRYELVHPAQTLPDELIEAMALVHENGTNHSGGHISDKTMYIALNYQEKVDKMNAHVTDEIASELVELEQVQNRLEQYISLLEPKQAEVIQLLYIERMTQKGVEKAFGYSVKTIRKLRNEALEALSEMYEYVTSKQ